MNYEKLLRDKMIEPVRVLDAEVAEHLRVARHDIKAGQAIAVIDLDWGFTATYNGLLQTALALMYYKCYRPRGEGKHYSTFEFLKLTLPKEWEARINRVQKLRQKRNKTVYEHRGLITERETKGIIEFADRFYKEIEAILPNEIVNLSKQED